MRTIYAQGVAVISVLFITLCFFPAEGSASDMRASHIDIEAKKASFRAKAQKELESAKQEALKQSEFIRSNRTELINAVEKLKSENSALILDNGAMEKELASLKEEQRSLSEALEQSSAVNRELAGFIRSSAKDLETLLIQSLQSGLPDRAAVEDVSQDAIHKRDESDHKSAVKEGSNYSFLKPVIAQEKFPSMEDIRKMVSALFQEIQSSGEVRLTKGTIVDRLGVEREAELLILGNFTAVYSIGYNHTLYSAEARGDGKTSSGSYSDKDGEKETGFLLYSDQSQRLFALSVLPERRVLENLNSYMAGERDDVYIDTSKGAALRQLTHKLDLLQQIPRGGPIVWPIIAIAAVALILLVERTLFFLRKRMNHDQFMKDVEALVLNNRWQECRALMERNRGKLIPKILLASIELRDQERTDMENALQEAILNEIPRVERFLSTLGMLAAIAPLLGLLGTVTGMINVFHTITYYGTGDPRMMSGGISEALVTTMLGLAAAIPIMLVHTLLSRRVETEIGKMEEKAVSFVNMVFKSRNGSQSAWIK